MAWPPGERRTGTALSEALEGFDARSTYDEASRDYEDASRDFWQYISLRTVDRLGLVAGERVLDVPCGSGASVVLAAQQVSPGGAVEGVDYAEQMIAIAREKTAAAGLANVRLSVADMTTLDRSNLEPFDSMICALGLFFADDMPGLLRSLFGLLRRGGRIAVSVFGEHVFDPMRQVFVETVGELAPDVEVLQPWRRTEKLPVLRTVFEAAGISDVAVVTEDDRLPLRSPGDWWRIVMGSGFRRTVAALDDPAVAELRRRCEAHIADHGIDHIVNRTHYAVARAAR
ncbi:MAG TPA: methyltransferase domain-containing protein [Acidimicrobiia bacterium]|nr:methyltransferase domain-containing protein [Acidimicrobiia bacterium]